MAVTQSTGKEIRTIWVGPFKRIEGHPAYAGYGNRIIAFPLLLLHEPELNKAVESLLKCAPTYSYTQKFCNTIIKANSHHGLIQSKKFVRTVGNLPETVIYSEIKCFGIGTHRGMAVHHPTAVEMLGYRFWRFLLSKQCKSTYQKAN